MRLVYLAVLAAFAAPAYSQTLCEQVQSVDVDLDQSTVIITGGYCDVPVPVNVPPIADAGADIAVTDSDLDGFEAVTLDGSASSDSDGVVETFVWAIPGQEVVFGQSISADFAVGAHTVLLTVTDDAGAQASDELSITVAGPEPDPEPTGSPEDGLVARSATQLGALANYIDQPYDSRLSWLFDRVTGICQIPDASDEVRAECLASADYYASGMNQEGEPDDPGCFGGPTNIGAHKCDPKYFYLSSLYYLAKDFDDVRYDAATLDKLERHAVTNGYNGPFPNTAPERGWAVAVVNLAFLKLMGSPTVDDRIDQFLTWLDEKQFDDGGWWHSYNAHEGGGADPDFDMFSPWMGAHLIGGLDRLKRAGVSDPRIDPMITKYADALVEYAFVPGGQGTDGRNASGLMPYYIVGRDGQSINNADTDLHLPEIHCAIYKAYEIDGNPRNLVQLAEAFTPDMVSFIESQSRAWAWSFSQCSLDLPVQMETVPYPSDPQPDPEPEPEPEPEPGSATAVVAFESSTQFSGSCVSENSFGLHLADLNLDGQQDIITLDHAHSGSSTTGHCFWSGNGAGTFTHDAVGTAQLSDINNSSCTWSAQVTDFTGDGKPDVWCRGSEAGSDFYENTTATAGGSATFNHTHGWLGEPGGSNVGGYKDDYMFFSDGPGLGLQRINDEGVIRRVSDGVETLDTGLLEPDVFDMDGDGLADLWSPTNRRVLKNLGGSFQEVTYDTDLDLCYWIGAAQHVDFDKDGDLDLTCLVYNDPSTTSDLVALRNDGGFQWSPVVVSHINANGNPSSFNFAYSNYRRNSLTKGTTTVADFDNNSWVDIALVNIGGAFQVYRQIGPAAFQSVDVGDVKTDAMRYRTKVASGDVNNDGKQDVIAALVDDTQTTARVLTNVTPTSNRSVVIKLAGAAPNTSGYGALIQALDAGGAIISSNYVDNSRRRTTNNYRHLGVGQYESVTIRVVWPGGAVSTYAGMATNARYVVSAGGITAL